MIRLRLSAAELRLLSWALYFSALSGRLRRVERGTMRRLLIRFAEADERMRKRLLRVADGIPQDDPVPEPPRHLERRLYPRVATFRRTG